MTSDKQARANRENARKSTGPKTPEGKAATRLNAVKHGLLSQQVLLPGEDAAALEELGERLRTELQPVGPLEDILAEQIIAAFWRLHRLRRVEAGIFAWERYGELHERAQIEAKSFKRDPLLDMIDKDTTITDEQKHQEALVKAQELQAEQFEETATLGRIFMRDASGAHAFSKLSRYEVAMERSLYRAVHELQRLQAARRAEGSVTPPVAGSSRASTRCPEVRRRRSSVPSTVPTAPSPSSVGVGASAIRATTASTARRSARCA